MNNIKINDLSYFSLFIYIINKQFKATSNILKAVAYKKPQINYCQGMNYIAAFLLEYIEDEEEAFFYFLGIIQNTEYGELFLNDLIKLKQFFYILERLINMYMPELYIYLKNSGISSSFFSSPWFITLFTHCYQYITEAKNPKILLFILDSFILVNYIYFFILLPLFRKVGILCLSLV